MQLIRTTLRIPTELKRAAEQIALDSNSTFQQVFHTALTRYIETYTKKKAKKIIFKTHNLGSPLDRLTRSDYYELP